MLSVNLPRSCSTDCPDRRVEDKDTDHTFNGASRPVDRASPTIYDLSPVRNAARAASTANGIRPGIDCEQLTAAAAKLPTPVLIMYVDAGDGYAVVS